MEIKPIIAVMLATLLCGCSVSARSPDVVVAAPAPAAETYVWARNDGRRMFGNPELLAKGQADQERCRLAATAAGALDQAAFIRCMEARGYSHRDA